MVAINALAQAERRAGNDAFLGPNIFNVRHYGATGDGSTDDNAAIQSCIDAAVAALPAVIWFPPGTYNIEDGLNVALSQGDEGLTIAGAGSEVSKIVLSGGSSFSSLFALRVYASVTPTPGTYSQYLRDITISDIGCFDDDPATHQAGDQTHGFSIAYCINAQINGCYFEDIGDEAINFSYVRGGVVSRNKLVNCPAVGTDGAAISVQNGSVDISISENIIWGSSVFGTRSTVASSSSKGIALEIVTAYDIDAIHIFANSIRDCGDRAIGTSISGAADVTNLQIIANTIDNCAEGFATSGTAGELRGVSIIGNSFNNCDYGLDMSAGDAYQFDISVQANTIVGSTTMGGRINATRLVTTGNILNDCARGWYIFNGDDCQFVNDLFDGCGSSGPEIESGTADNITAIGCVSLNSDSDSEIFYRIDEVRNCIIKDRAVTPTNPEQTVKWCRNVIGCTIEGGITASGTRGIISNNNISFVFTGTVQTEAGIRLDSGSDDYVISGNNIDLSGCTNNQYCIRIRSGSTGNIAIGNIVKSVTAGSANAVSVEGSGTLVADYTNNNISS